ncbi:MAG: 3-oxo-tetronate kinase [Terracoccus sp.]
MTGPGDETSGHPRPPSHDAPTIGIVADDITGATDVAGALTDVGLRTTLVFGVPDAADLTTSRCDAVVVALKSRTLPPLQAVEQSVASLERLRDSGVTRFYLKYCSTFDSTEEGNIGPVADAAMALLGSHHVVHLPAYPANGRTVYQGHLFVGRHLLSESGMEHHPLTPMTDPNLVRFLAHQTQAGVTLLPLEVLRSGSAPSAIRNLLRAEPVGQATHIIADSITNEDLDAVATASVAHDSALLAGGAAYAAAWGRALGLGRQPSPFVLPGLDTGPAAVLVGSASSATRRQVAAFEADHPTRRLTADGLQCPERLADELVAWAAGLMAEQPVLIAADTTPAGIDATRQRFGHEAASARIERALGLVAKGLVTAGVRRLVVAGGETSGAVAQALGIRSVRIGPSICPGVPWTASSDPDIAIAFKSGNFGGDDFFAEALRLPCRPQTEERP